MLELLVPLGERIDPIGKMNPLPQVLKGQTIGFLDNCKYNADALLDCVGDLLTKRHEIDGVRKVRKPHEFQPAPQELLDSLARDCSLVVNAVGD